MLTLTLSKVSDWLQYILFKATLYRKILRLAPMILEMLSIDAILVFLMLP